MGNPSPYPSDTYWQSRWDQMAAAMDNDPDGTLLANFRQIGNPIGRWIVRQRTDELKDNLVVDEIRQTPGMLVEDMRDNLRGNPSNVMLVRPSAYDADGVAGAPIPVTRHSAEYAWIIHHLAPIMPPTYTSTGYAPPPPVVVDIGAGYGGMGYQLRHTHHGILPHYGYYVTVDNMVMWQVSHYFLEGNRMAAQGRGMMYKRVLANARLVLAIRCFGEMPLSMAQRYIDDVSRYTPSGCVFVSVSWDHCSIDPERGDICRMKDLNFRIRLAGWDVCWSGKFPWEPNPARMLILRKR